jgi:hypothetical protein
VFKAKIENLSKLMYSIKRENLGKFVKDPANIALLTYFHQQDGLTETDPKSERPACRLNALETLI